jgi:hypothetical protein
MGHESSEPLPLGLNHPREAKNGGDRKSDSQNAKLKSDNPTDRFAKVPTQRPAEDRHPLRPMRSPLRRGHLHRRTRRLQAQSMNPKSRPICRAKNLASASNSLPADAALFGSATPDRTPEDACVPHQSIFRSG